MKAESSSMEQTSLCIYFQFWMATHYCQSLLTLDKFKHRNAKEYANTSSCHTHFIPCTGTLLLTLSRRRGEARGLTDFSAMMNSGCTNALGKTLINQRYQLVNTLFFHPPPNRLYWRSFIGLLASGSCEIKQSIMLDSKWRPFALVFHFSLYHSLLFSFSSWGCTP